MPSGSPPETAHLRSVARTAALWAAPLAFLALFYALPMAQVLRLSLARGTSLGAPFVEAFASPGVRGVLGFTFLQASLSTLLTLLLGLPGAYLLARYAFRGRSALLALTSVPFVMPTLVVGAAFQALLGPRGWVNLGLMALLGLSQPPIEFLNSLGAILLAHVFYNTTIVLRLVGDFWSHLDPRIEAAARTLGASRWQVLRLVVFPVAAPGIFTAAILVFIHAWNEFFFALIILTYPAVQTLPVGIALFPGEYTMPWGEIAAASTLATLPLIALTLICQRRIVQGLSAGAVKG